METWVEFADIVEYGQKAGKNQQGGNGGRNQAETDGDGHGNENLSLQTALV